MTGWVHALGNLGVFAGAASASLFVVVYWLTAPWWKSQEGWHLMAFTGCLGLTLDYSSWRIVTSQVHLQSAGVEVVRAAVFLAVGGLLVWRLVMLYHAQIRPARDLPALERDSPSAENAEP